MRSSLITLLTMPKHQSWSYKNKGNEKIIFWVDLMFFKFCSASLEVDEAVLIDFKQLS